MKILITGINGFVGNVLRKSLEDKGYDVSGIDIRTKDPNVYEIDITNQSEVIECLRKIEPDFIFHLAAISKVDYANPWKLYDINVTGTLNMLASATKLSRKPRFFLVSSSQVYGIVDEQSQPINEQTPINPVNHYGASKASAEHIAQVFHHDYDLPLVIVRPFNHIGRGQDPHFVIPKIIKAIKDKNENIELGNLSVVRDFLDVRDVIDIYCNLMEQFPDGKIFNIASGEGYKLSDIIQMIQQISKVHLNIKHIDTLVRKNEIVMAIGDYSELNHLLGWKPKYSMTETLEWILS